MVIVKRGPKKWILYNKKKTKILGKFPSRKAALKRERQIVWFAYGPGRKKKR